MPSQPHGNKRLSQIWFFYANIIGYIRLILIIVSAFGANKAVHENSFGWAIFAFVCNYTGGWLLDWIDGPVARRYNQCTAFGTAFDWYCDLFAEVVLVFWAAELRLRLALWLVFVLALELGSALVDTNNTAVGYKWSEFAPKDGVVFRVLNIVYPNGRYNKWGTALWILFSTWAFSHILIAHTPADFSRLAFALNILSIALIPAAVGYILHIVAYMIALVSGWKEPINASTGSHDD